MIILIKTSQVERAERFNTDIVCSGNKIIFNASATRWRKHLVFGLSARPSVCRMFYMERQKKFDFGTDSKVKARYLKSRQISNEEDLTEAFPVSSSACGFVCFFPVKGLPD